MVPMGNMTVAERLEGVLVKNLGEVGRFLMAQCLEDLGIGPGELSEENVPLLIVGIKRDFEKVIGYGVQKLEEDLLDCLKEE